MVRASGAARPGGGGGGRRHFIFPTQHSPSPSSHFTSLLQLATTAAAAAHGPSGSPLRIMISGPPAAGKGTQCARIVDRWGLVHISAGDLLRAEVGAGTPAGVQAKAFMDAGKLVPNEVVVGMVTSRLAAPDARERGWLLDGYPRSSEQADAVEGAGVRPDLFLLLDVPDDELVARVTGRRTDPVTSEIYHLTFKPPPADPAVLGRLVQRSDDTEDALRARLETHHANVAAVVGYYEDVLVRIDGSGSMDAVFGAVEEAVEGVAGCVAAAQEAAA